MISRQTKLQLLEINLAVERSFNAPEVSSKEGRPFGAKDDLFFRLSYVTLFRRILYR